MNKLFGHFVHDLRYPGATSFKKMQNNTIKCNLNLFIGEFTCQKMIFNEY